MNFNIAQDVMVNNFNWYQLYSDATFFQDILKKSWEKNGMDMFSSAACMKSLNIVVQAMASYARNFFRQTVSPTAPLMFLVNCAPRFVTAFLETSGVV